MSTQILITGASGAYDFEEPQRMADAFRGVDVFVKRELARHFRV